MAVKSRGGYAYPDDWPVRRARALVRDGYRCQLCGGMATEVDHIRGLADGGSHEPDNLRAVCAPCHKMLTRQQAIQGRRRARRRQLSRTPAGRNRLRVEAAFRNRMQGI